MFELETAADMSVEDNRADALHAFDRCVTDDDFAVWARKYGRHLCFRDGPDLQVQLDDAWEEATDLEASKDRLYIELEGAKDTLDQMECSDRKAMVIIDKLIETIEQALKREA